MADVPYPYAAQVNRIREKYPELAELARIYAAFAPILSASDIHVAKVGLTRAQATERLARGAPLLEGEKLEFDATSVATLVSHLAKAIEELDTETITTNKLLWFRADRRKKPRECEKNAMEEDKHLATNAREIRLLIEQGKLDPARLVTCAFAEDSAPLMDLAAEYGADAGLLTTLTQHALRRGFAVWRTRFAPPMDEIEWRHDYCFVCGAPALLGELQGDQGEKHLRCGRCGADWPMPRLACVHCGNDDERTLAFLYSEGELESRRVQVCDDCGEYIKLIASYSPVPPEMLPIEDLLTMDLDYVAAARGYYITSARDESADSDPMTTTF